MCNECDVKRRGALPLMRAFCAMRAREMPKVPGHDPRRDSITYAQFLKLSRPVRATILDMILMIEERGTRASMLSELVATAVAQVLARHLGTDAMKGGGTGPGDPTVVDVAALTEKIRKEFNV